MLYYELNLNTKNERIFRSVCNLFCINKGKSFSGKNTI